MHEKTVVIYKIIFCQLPVYAPSEYKAVVVK
jgi:hypothetical protein